MSDTPTTWPDVAQRTLIGLAIAAVIGLLIWGFMCMASSQDARMAVIAAENAKQLTLVPRRVAMDQGDCIPFRVVEMEDATQIVVIGDYRKDTFVVMQRFAEGWRIVYPATGVPADSVRGVMLKLEGK